MMRTRQAKTQQATAIVIYYSQTGFLRTQGEYLLQYKKCCVSTQIQVSQLQSTLPHELQDHFSCLCGNEYDCMVFHSISVADTGGGGGGVGGVRTPQT